MDNFKFESSVNGNNLIKNGLIFSFIFHLCIVGTIGFVKMYKGKSTVVKKVYLFNMVNLEKKIEKRRAVDYKPPIKKVKQKKSKKIKVAPKAVSNKKVSKKRVVKEEKLDKNSEKVEEKTTKEVLENEMTLSKPNFPFNFYEQQIINAVERNWQTTPQELLGAELQLVVTVRFNILKNGSIANLKIVESSWNSILDRLAMRAIERASLPPIPGAESKLSITYRLVLKRD